MAKSDKFENHELIEIFHEETQELIDKMRKDLMSLSEGQTPSILLRLFRYAHNIKSSSGIVGFEDLEIVTKTLEKIFKAASDRRFVLTDDVIFSLSESVEVCHKLLNKEKVVGYEKSMERLNSILQP